jgi:hypothetical protein
MTQYFIFQEASETLDTTRPWMDETRAIRQNILANQTRGLARRRTVVRKSIPSNRVKTQSRNSAMSFA